MVFVITGLSGVGKSTISKEVQTVLFKRRRIFLPELKLVTDRPMRPGEQDGEDYFFLTKDEYSDFLKAEVFATNEIIEVYQDVWKYGALKGFLNENRILAGSPEQVRQLKLFLGDENVVSINVIVGEEERIKRIMRRKDNQHEEEIKRRTKEDMEKYANFKPDYKVSNNGIIFDAVEEVANIIEKYI